nr:vacuolar proton pump 116K chain - bovine (fragments) [Bos taurus]
DLNPDVNVFQRANIPIMDTGENPEVPFPRMIDLEANFEKNFLELTELKTQQFFDEMADPDLLEEAEPENPTEDMMTGDYVHKVFIIFFQGDQLTYGFQNIVDAYGIGTYRVLQLNPFVTGVFAYPF